MSSTMDDQKPAPAFTGWKKSLLWMALAVACFHIAYASVEHPALGLFIFGYAFFLVKLTDQPTVRRAFYLGLATGFLCGAPQLFFFWTIFHAAAVVLWLVFAFWIGLFTAMACGSIRRWGKGRALWLVPILWTGIEYFRSELYYLKFSWLNVGYALHAFHVLPSRWGMYGAGLFAFFAAALLCFRRPRVAVPLVSLVAAVLLAGSAITYTERSTPAVALTGVQMEFPPPNILPKALDKALAQNTNAQILVLSEYTLEGGVPDSLKDWCRANSRYLVVGGKDVITNHLYYNTAFVVGTNGEIVFKQAKSVPIQFFDDGLPAPSQQPWDSPFGKIGICICYDLSYTRVTDELIRQGAQLLIVPTMDVTEWGRHEHELHSRVAPTRAVEYGIPIFRLASSGISQAVNASGGVVAQTAFEKQGDTLSAWLRLSVDSAQPIDRPVARTCTALAAVVLAALLFHAWRERRRKQP